MNRPRAARHPEPDGNTKLGVLAAAVGHELSNIAVPLDGFTDLAFQSIAASDPARQHLEEIRIAITRVKSLAWELQSLGEFESSPARLPIGACLLTGGDGTRPKSWRIDWQCSERAAITVDRLHAERSIEALARFAAAGSARAASDLILRISQGPSPLARCSACSAVLPRKKRYVSIQAVVSRAIRTDVLRDPLGSAEVHRSGRRVALAVLVHCAHRAGGHVLLDAGGNSLGLAFPAA